MKRGMRLQTLMASALCLLAAACATQAPIPEDRVIGYPGYIYYDPFWGPYYDSLVWNGYPYDGICNPFCGGFYGAYYGGYGYYPGGYYHGGYHHGGHYGYPSPGWPHPPWHGGPGYHPPGHFGGQGGHRAMPSHSFSHSRSR
ncbi:MAG: hypothetical protein JWR07_2655 [Nevskia sp.]|nr:hypothetical protein [Nevskia sp.]